MRSGCREMSANGIPHSCISTPPYHESASEENRGERGYGTLTFKDLAVTRNITSGLFNDGYVRHGSARQCVALDWNAWVEGNVPRRSLGGNTTPSGGLLICSIGAKVSAMGGRGMTAGDMVCEFVVIKSFWNRRIWEDKMEFSVTLPYISTNPRSLMRCWGRPHTTRTTTTTKKKNYCPP